MMTLLLYVSRHFPCVLVLYATSVMGTIVHSSVSSLDSTVLQLGVYYRRNALIPMLHTSHHSSLRRLRVPVRP